MQTALLAVAAVALASCSTGEAFIVRCPALQQYSQAQQTKALAELKATEGQIPQVKEMMNDFNRLRKACRAAEQVAAPKPLISPIFPH